MSKIFRADHQPPQVVAREGWRYHHIGIPTDQSRPGERLIAHLGMWVSGFETSPYGIEWMRFELESPIPKIIQTTVHIAFEVDDINSAIRGRQLIGEISSPSPGVRVAMISDGDVLIEVMEFDRHRIPAAQK
ncbi:MAG: hypothetical protein E4H13_10860 [Calditrichales bacterium]|nr:MAG: hypothetical protein E4H13_10860 [Calditrichales bacterium]